MTEQINDIVSQCRKTGRSYINLKELLIVYVDGVAKYVWHGDLSDSGRSPNEVTIEQLKDLIQ